MLEFNAWFLMLSSPWFWTTGEFFAFAFAYLLVQGELGNFLKMIGKIVLTIVIVFAVIIVAGLYIISYKRHPKAIATITNVVNSDIYGGYSQKLTLKYTYNDTEYVVEDVSTINLCAEAGDRYVVKFSSKNPEELGFIDVNDKLPAPWQVFVRSVIYGAIGIIIFLIIVKIIRNRS